MAGSERETSYDSTGNEDEEGAFLDLEATEAAWDTSDSHSEGDLTEHHAFHQFVRLPIELRYRIWTFFCPDLTAKARVFAVKIGRGHDTSWVSDSVILEQQTAPARAVLSVHHESRAMALKFLPDTLPLRPGGAVLLRLNLETDVIYFEGTELIYETFKGNFYPVPGFHDKLRHVAVDHREIEFSLDFPNPWNLDGFLHVPGLQTLYLLSEDRQHRQGDNHRLGWCVSDTINRSYLQTFEIEPDIGEDYQEIICWPDLVKNREFAESSVSLGENHQALRDALNRLREAYAGKSIHPPVGRGLDDFHCFKFEVWPMVHFQFDKGVARYDKLKAWNGNDDDWSSASETDDDSDDPRGPSDEYESDGIDDAEIDEDASSDEEDDLAVLSERSDSPVESESSGRPTGDFDFGMEVGDAMARFSSVSEAESTGRDGEASQATDAASDAGNVARSHRPARRRILSSESGDGSEAEEDQGQARKRRAHVISDSSDEEDEPTAIRSMLPIDLTADDGEVEEATSDDDDVEVAARPMSLAERLRLHREQNPISSEESDSGAESENTGTDADHSLEGEGEDSELGSNADEVFDADEAEDED